MTYGELSALAAAVAPRVPRVACAVVCAALGWEAVVAVLAAATAGVPFHVVDPAAPEWERWQLLAAFPSAAVLTTPTLDRRLRWPEGTERVVVDAQAADGGAQAECAAAAEDALCLVVPADAGEMTPLSHRAAVDVLTDLAARFELGEDDRWLALCPLSDAIGLTTVLGALTSGGAVVIPDPFDVHTPAVWFQVIQDDAVTVWHATPSLSALLAEHLVGRGETVAGLRIALLGGEPLAPSTVERLRTVAGPDLRVANLAPGGPAGLWATCAEVGGLDELTGHVPIGGPLAHRRLYVLSDALTPCPVWVTGRVHLGGRGLPAPGTAGPIVELPATGEPLYRTDLIGRLLPDGAVEVLGDDRARIHVHGHPLNLREVEALLAAHPAVLGVAVVPSGEGSVAYAKVAAGTGVTGADLMAHLRTRMSPFLLPSRIELVGSFALTATGRTDRAMLTAVAAPQQREAAAPVAAPVPAELVRRACALTAEVLGMVEVEENMNLLDLGASSIQLVRLATRAEAELGLEVDVEELFRFPSVAVLVSASRPVAVPAPPSLPSGGLILDPEDRSRFVARRPGLRHELADRPGAGLDRALGDVVSRYARRRTCREFAPVPVPAASFADLLAALVVVDEAGPRHAYPSAGSLFPVQVHVTVAAGRVDGTPAGAYYLDPVGRRLVGLQEGGGLPVGAHAWINRGAYRASAFSIYLVADLAAITPLYGVRSRDYCLIEAGAMCQLLMTVAADIGLGLCPVGDLDASALQEMFRLGADHEVVHTLLGGVPAGDDEQVRRAREEAMLDRLARR